MSSLESTAVPIPPFYETDRILLYHADCRDVLPQLETASVDAVITDPIYPEIDRDYGRMTEDEWFDMMYTVVPQVRRILKPSGSAVFILQPNSERVGRMRTWLWKFMAWIGDEWGIVQDAYWWNTTTMPQGSEERGLMRASLKPCVWMGSPGCYRKQSAVLWQETQSNVQLRMASRLRNDNGIRYTTSKAHVRPLRATEAAERRGGVTPFNVLPIPNCDSTSSAGAKGHGAGTPLELAHWWTRYICPPGGVVCDPFAGSSTMGIAALEHGASFIGIERMEKHARTSRRRLGRVRLGMPLGL